MTKVIQRVCELSEQQLLAKLSTRRLSLANAIKRLDFPRAEMYRRSVNRLEKEVSNRSKESVSL